MAQTEVIGVLAGIFGVVALAAVYWAKRRPHCSNSEEATIPRHDSIRSVVGRRLLRIHQYSEQGTRDFHRVVNFFEFEDGTVLVFGSEGTAIYEPLPSRARTLNQLSVMGQRVKKVFLMSQEDTEPDEVSSAPDGAHDQLGIYVTAEPPLTREELVPVE